MMRTTTQRQVSAVLLSLVGAQAVHWFITPLQHPDAGLFRTSAVVVQAVLGIAGAVWLLRAVPKREHGAISN